MSTYVEVELRCDGVEGDPFGCDSQVFARTAERARRDARAAGWLTAARGGQDFCPDHRANRSDTKQETP